MVAVKQPENRNLVLTSRDGDRLTISSDIARKIPKLRDMQHAFDASTLQSIIRVVTEVYHNAPVLAYDKQFFKQTSTHPAYTPAYIPQQVRDIIAEEVGDPTVAALAALQQAKEKMSKGRPQSLIDVLNEEVGEQDYNAFITAADMLGLNWVAKAVKSPNAKSIADVVATGALQEYMQKRRSSEGQILNLKNQNIVSLVGTHLIDDEIAKNMVEIDASLNLIKTISSGVVKNLHNLEMLHLSDSLIERIEPGAFDKASNLEALDLSLNLLKAVTPDMLRGVSGLEILLLEGNEIAKIPSNIFEQAPNLRFIDLARNQIKRLQPTVFQGLKNLTLVDLEGNPLAPHVKDRIKQALSAEIDLLF
jgi:hypothetical protein